MTGMQVFLHTICVEPAGWPELRTGMADLGLRPAILTAYVNLAKTEEAAWEDARVALAEAVEFFGFSAIRLFPGSGCSPDDTTAREILLARLGDLAVVLPGIGLWLETHDGSLADDPEGLARLVEEAAQPAVGLIFQPTRFTPEETRAPHARQRGLVHHFHLQNRQPDLSFATLSDGVLDWAEILATAPEGATASIEFVPTGIRPVEAFDFEATLAEAASEAAAAAGWAGNRTP
jgi:sugar phosphate isomerase/epimerase